MKEELRYTLAIGRFSEGLLTVGLTILAIGRVEIRVAHGGFNHTIRPYLFIFHLL